MYRLLHVHTMHSRWRPYCGGGALGAGVRERPFRVLSSLLVVDEGRPPEPGGRSRAAIAYGKTIEHTAARS